jgi:hypothetical protein
MLDHALVHSCFGFHSSFEFRISPFTQVHGSLSNPPRTPWDAAGTQRDGAGLIGTALGPEKDGFLSPLVDAHNRITTFRAASYVSDHRNHTPSKHLFLHVVRNPARPSLWFFTVGSAAPTCIRDLLAWASRVYSDKCTG